MSAVKNKNWKQESAHGRKDGREKMLRQETLWQSRPVRSNGFAWKINHCGIFCASQKGSESKGKVSYHLSSQDRVSSGSHVQILWSVQSYAFVHRLGRPEQDAALAEVIAKQRERSFRMNRDFHASKPNSKWVTDISYIHTRQGVLYLSMIRDLYDNSIVACKTGTEQTVNLVLDTIRLAMKQEKEKVAAELQLHSDQGAQYASQVYFKLTQTYGITPYMSRRGNPYDNAMAENFFSILKTECIYRHKPATFSQANELIDCYIYFYNHERIQLKTGEASRQRRLSA